MLSVGLDIHGVIDAYQGFFSRLSKGLKKRGCPVHIITGQSWEEVKSTVEKAGIHYDYHFSIVDYHLEIGTKMKKDAKGWHMDDRIWVRSKGDYIHREKIDLHFDDSYEYAEYCPPNCTFVLVPKTNFEATFLSLSNLMGYIIQ